MRLPNGYGSVKKMSGKRRKPYIVQVTTGWDIVEGEKLRQRKAILGYTATRAEGLQLLADYNKSPYDIEASKVTFQKVFERWSKEKYPTISESNKKGYNASYNICGTLYNKVFKDIKLPDLQSVVDSSGKNYPTLKKLVVLFNQLYDYAMKNELCNKDYSRYVNIAKYKDRNPDKRDHNKFTKEEIEKLWSVSEDHYYQTILMLIYSGCRISEILD